MRILVRTLKEGEHEFRFVHPKDGGIMGVANHLKKEGYPLRGKFEVEVRLTNLDPDYFLRGKLLCETETVCARCAESFPLTVNHNFELGLNRVEQLEAEKMVLGADSDSVDLSYFQGEELDLGPLVEEQFFLGVPYQALCQEGCKGICQVCGQNRNERDCGCQPNAGSSPFAVLNRLKDKS